MEDTEENIYNFLLFLTHVFYYCVQLEVMSINQD